MAGTFLIFPMAKKASHKKIKKSSLARKSAKKKSAKKKSFLKKSHKKAVSRKAKKSTVKRVSKPKPQVTFIPEPWSKVVKYKKIKKDGYYSRW